MNKDVLDFKVIVDYSLFIQNIDTLHNMFDQKIDLKFSEGLVSFLSAFKKLRKWASISKFHDYYMWGWLLDVLFDFYYKWTLD